MTKGTFGLPTDTEGNDLRFNDQKRQTKLTTEQLDMLQFGKPLHQRPTDADIRDCIAAVISDHAQTNHMGFVKNADEVAEKVLELCWHGSFGIGSTGGSE